MSPSPESRLHRLCARRLAGDHLEFIFFWGHEAPPGAPLSFECLSPWYPSPFTVDGTLYPTAEHFLMAAKARLFGDRATFERIVAAPDPGAALAFGRQVEGYVQEIWEQERFAAAVDGNFAKFGQNPHLATYLASTRDKILAQATPMELVWGIGLSPKHSDATNPAKWRGANLLGFALMEVRDRLRSAAGA